MRVESHNALGQPRSFEASRVVIYDAAGNPIALAVEVSPELVLTSTVGQPDFKPILKNFGIDRTVVVTRIQEKPLKDVVFEK